MPGLDTRKHIHSSSLLGNFGSDLLKKGSASKCVDILVSVWNVACEACGMLGVE